MREILFKAKRIDNEEWVEGSYLYCKKATTVSFRNEHYILVFDGYGVAYHEIDKDTICQYTGLTDKNGNKIWENDVALYPFDGNSGDGTKAVIRYGKYDNNGNQDCYLGFYVDWQERIQKRRDIGFWVYKRDIEVIGNTFDNPGLLKGGVVNE